MGPALEEAALPVAIEHFMDISPGIPGLFLFFGLPDFERTSPEFQAFQSLLVLCFQFKYFGVRNLLRSLQPEIDTKERCVRVRSAP